LDGNLKPFLKHDIINADVQMQSLIAEGVDIKYGHFSNRKSLVAMVRAGLRIRQICLKEEMDIVHVLWGTTTALVTVLFSPRPVIISFCGSDLLGTKSQTGKLTKGGKMNRIISQVAAHFAAQIITKSEQMRSVLPKRIRSKTKVIPNGVNISSFYPMPVLLAKKKLGWDNTKKHVLFFYTEGQVVKNPDMAFKVMEMVSQELPASELVIATKIQHEQLIYYYNASDVMILTSYHEGSNNSLKEANACNLPIVSVNVGDAKERLKDIESCHVVDSFDPELFKDKVIDVLKAGKRSNGITRVHEVSVENVSRRIISVYGKILGE
jgi:glycosyltransferase involved in cell wall biosynthesis